MGKLAEILRDQRPSRKVTAMFIDMAFGSPIYERLRALGFNNVFETNFGLVQTPDRTKANMRAYMWDQMKDWFSGKRRGALRPRECWECLPPCSSGRHGDPKPEPSAPQGYSPDACQ